VLEKIKFEGVDIQKGIFKVRMQRRYTNFLQALSQNLANRQRDCPADAAEHFYERVNVKNGVGVDFRAASSRASRANLL